MGSLTKKGLALERRVRLCQIRKDGGTGRQKRDTKSFRLSQCATCKLATAAALKVHQQTDPCKIPLQKFHLFCEILRAKSRYFVKEKMRNSSCHVPHRFLWSRKNGGTATPTTRSNIWQTTSRPTLGGRVARHSWAASSAGSVSSSLPCAHQLKEYARAAAPPSKSPSPCRAWRVRCPASRLTM
jgi:hypothetical protein